MRILLVKLSSVGDIVHTLPAAAALRRALPAAHISWVVERRASEILTGCPIIDQLIELDTRSWRARPFNRSTVEAIRSQLRQVRGDSTGEPPDAAIDFQGLLKSGLVAFASRAPRRVGFETSELREPASRLFLTEQVQTAHLERVIDKNLRLALSLIPEEQRADVSGRYEFPIEVTTEDLEYAEGILSEHGGTAAIINPGGGWPTKLWEPSRYGRLADYLWLEYRLASLVTHGPGEESLARAVVENAKAGAARMTPCTLKQFVAIARSAALFVGGDTGPLHLAAACGTPIVGLYGPTSPSRNGPFDPRDQTVGRDLWCRADCHRRKCWHWECMEIPVEAVASAIAARLSVKNDSAGEPPSRIHPTASRRSSPASPLAAQPD